MKIDYWQTIEKVFNQAFLVPIDERYSFIQNACGEDKQLCREVFSLLDEAEKSGEFLSQPVFELGTQILASDIIGIFDDPHFASYELIKILGRGATGTVFLAEDLTLERLVALKIFPAGLAETDERILRFRQEAKAASSISHPNVAHIYEFGKADSRYYLAMEYVSGKTLRELIKEHKIVTVTALNIAIQIAKALSAIHQTGIIHRDIKPENIIVMDDGLVKVLDFGLAKIYASSNSTRIKTPSIETEQGLIIGTTAYMSPEQVRGKPLDSRTDIWSLGVILYELLAGSRPFSGDTPSDVQAFILLAEPPFILEIKEFPELQKVLSKTLTKDVGARYQTASALAHDLEIIRQQLDKSPKEIHFSFSSEKPPSFD